MRIIGIDPGTGITGFGIIEASGTKAKLIDAGVVRTKPHTSQSERLKTIFDCLTELIKEHRPTDMAIEKLFFTTNVTTAMTVSEARGVALLCAEQAGLKVGEYTPLQIKQSMTGYGKAEKYQVQEMVRTLLGLKEVPKPDDCADALATALTHAFSVR